MKKNRHYPSHPPMAQRTDIPPSVGQGEVKVEKLSSGLQLMVVNFMFKQSAQFRRDSSGFTVGIGFCLKNGYISRHSCFDNPISAKTNASGFFHYPELTDWTMKVDRGPLHNVFVLMNKNTLHKLVGDDESYFPFLEKLETNRPFLTTDFTTPEMNLVLSQIASCPYIGSAGRLYTESKVVELLVLKLEQLRLGNHSLPKTNSLRPVDIECVRHAVDVLVKDLENPPNLAALARSVGLSRSKLHRCFGEVYGISPFDYLRNFRLQTAMNLLREGEANVTEAAFSVGYTNLSHFAKTFKSTFGILPSDILSHSIPVSDHLKRFGS